MGKMPLRGYRMRHVADVSWEALGDGRYQTKVAVGEGLPELTFTVFPVDRRILGRGYDLAISPAHAQIERSALWPFGTLMRAFQEAAKTIRAERRKRDPLLQGPDVPPKVVNVPPTLFDIIASPELLEVGRKAVEDELIDLRDRGIFVMNRNGLAIYNKDGSPSSIIRLPIAWALVIALKAIVSKQGE